MLPLFRIPTSLVCGVPDDVRWYSFPCFSLHVYASKLHNVSKATSFPCLPRKVRTATLCGMLRCHNPKSQQPGSEFQVRRRRKEKERLLVMLQPRTTHTGRPLLLIDDLRLRWDQVPSPKSLGPRMISKYRTVCPCGNYYSPLEPDSLHF